MISPGTPPSPTWMRCHLWGYRSVFKIAVRAVSGSSITSLVLSGDLDEFNHLNIEFASFRESIDTPVPLVRAIVVIIGAIAELERNLIVERVEAGMRHAKLEGRHIGRRPIAVDREAILCDRRGGQSLRKIAKRHRISTATVRRVLCASADQNAA